jgi:endo-1,4-beta-xylanase
LIARCAGTGQVCALTFDDGPNGDTTWRLLDFLAAHRIRAVFCVIGRNIGRPDGARLLRRMVADGHVLAAHSMRHVDMGRWPRAEIRADLEANLVAIRDALDDGDREGTVDAVIAVVTERLAASWQFTLPESAL